jgi:hypothetical protein
LKKLVWREGVADNTAISRISKKSGGKKTKEATLLTDRQQGERASTYMVGRT